MYYRTVPPSTKALELMALMDSRHLQIHYFVIRASRTVSRSDGCFNDLDEELLMY